MEVRCPVCHRRERWSADGGREVLLEGGARRSESAQERALFDCLHEAATGRGEAVLAPCACGQALVGPDEGLPHPQSEAVTLVLPEGTFEARGREVSMDGASVDWPMMVAGVHARLPAVEKGSETLFERLFAGSLITMMLVPIGVWCVAVFVVFVFWRQFATEGVPVGMPF